MNSMTGFGFSEVTNDQYQISLDIKTYNNRYLDLILNIPPNLNPLEPKIRAKVGQYLKRGRVEIYLRYKELQEDIELHLDESAAIAYKEILDKLVKVTGINEEVRLNHLLRQEGIIKAEKKRDLDLIWDTISILFDKTLKDVNKMREREGALTQKDIRNNLDLISQEVAQIKERQPELETFWKNSLIERIKDVHDEIDEQRVLTEVALLLARFDVNEELIRLDGHIQGMMDMMTEDQPVGKKMDFLCQEMNREANTIGSKMSQIEIQRGVVNIKDALEKIREQLRNVE